MAGESLHATRGAIAEAWLVAGRVDEARELLSRARADLLSAVAGLPDESWIERALTQMPEHAKLMALAAKVCGPVVRPTT